MPAVSDHHRYVMLRNGLALPIEPIRLALDLESRGIRLTRDGDDLIIEPWSRLTDADLDGLRQWKPHMLAIVGYEPEAVQ